MIKCEKILNILRTAISETAAFILRTILFGVKDLSIVENNNIFTAGHKFVKESGQFWSLVAMWPK